MPPPPLPRKQRIACCVNSNAQLSRSPHLQTERMREVTNRGLLVLCLTTGDEARVKKDKGPRNSFFLLFSAELRRGGPRWVHDGPPHRGPPPCAHAELLSCLAVLPQTRAALRPSGPPPQLHSFWHLASAFSSPAPCRAQRCPRSHILKNSLASI